MLNPADKHDYKTLCIADLIMLLEQKDLLLEEIEAKFLKLALRLNIREKKIFGRSSEKASVIDLKDQTNTDFVLEESEKAESDQEVSDPSNQEQHNPEYVVVEDIGYSIPEPPPKAKRIYKKPHLGRLPLSDGFEKTIVLVNIPDYNPEKDRQLEPAISRKFSIKLIISVEETHRQRIRRDGEVLVAPFAANNPFYKHKLSLDSVALMLHMRFALHIPYYRFHNILPENTIGYNTLVETAGKACKLLAPLDQPLLNEVKKDAKRLSADESHYDNLDSEKNIKRAIDRAKAAVPKKDPVNEKKDNQEKDDQKDERDTKKSTSTQQKIKHTGRIWSLVNEAKKLVYFRFCPTRGMYNAEALLEGYCGLLMSDAYIAYIRIAEEARNNIRLMLCWSHGRRKFTDLIQKGKKTDPVIIEIIRRIGLIFIIEQEIKDKSDEEILAARQQSFKILTELKTYLEEKRKLYLPKEAIVESIDYLLNHWQYFIEYTKHVDGCCHNNAAEQSLRPVVISRKNALFFGSGQAGEGAALMFALAHNCKLHNIDFLTWVTDVLKRIESHPKDRMDELLPHKWLPLAKE